MSADNQDCAESAEIDKFVKENEASLLMILGYESVQVDMKNHTNPIQPSNGYLQMRFGLL